MEKFLICLDVSGDVDANFSRENNLIFLPMNYSMNDEFKQYNGIETKENFKLFYDGQRKGDLTKTSQITPFMYEEFFTPYLEKGNDILYFALSSGLSNTFASSCLAVEELKDKFPNQKVITIDSLSATGGMGILVEKAVEFRNKGVSLEETAEKIKELIKHIHHWFLVEDLMYLKRGGRISASTAIVGSALGIKPVLKIDENGKLINVSKKHGRKAASLGCLEKFNEYFDENLTDEVYITHSDSLDLAIFIAGEITKAHPTIKVRITMLSPIIGAHTGPGCMTICHLGK